MHFSKSGITPDNVAPKTKIEVKPRKTASELIDESMLIPAGDTASRENAMALIGAISAVKLGLMTKKDVTDAMDSLNRSLNRGDAAISYSVGINALATAARDEIGPAFPVRWNTVSR